MSRELEGKVAVVTGAARNIGRAIALDLSRAGAKIVVNAMTSAESASETAKLIRDEGGEAIVHLADVTDPAAADGLPWTAESLGQYPPRQSRIVRHQEEHQWR